MVQKGTSRARAGREEPGGAFYETRFFGLRPHHEPWGVTQEYQRDPERAAEQHEVACLVGRFAVDRAPEVHWIVGNDADRLSFDPRQRGNHARAKAAPQLQHRLVVGQGFDDPAHVVDAKAVLWNRHAQQALVRAGPVGEGALKIRKVFLRHGDGLLVVVHQHVDHAVAVLRCRRSDIFGRIDAETSAFDHRGPAHADVRGLRRDHDVAATEQRGIPSKTAAGIHADERNLSGELSEVLKGSAIEACHDRMVRVAWPAAAALGEKDDGKPPLLGELEHAVLLQMIHRALRPGEHGVVVRHDDTLRARLPKGRPVHAADACDHPVRGRPPDRARRWIAAASGQRSPGRRTRPAFPRRRGRRRFRARCAGRFCDASPPRPGGSRRAQTHAAR